MVFARFLLKAYCARVESRRSLAKRLGVAGEYLSMIGADYYPSAELGEALARETKGAVPVAAWGIKLRPSRLKRPGVIRRTS